VAGLLVRLVLTIGLAVAAVGAVAYGAVELWRYAQSWALEQPRFQFAVAAVEYTPPPIWVRANLLADVQRSAGLPDTINALEAGLAERVAGAFALHPWVREVRRVRLQHPHAVWVELSYREPVARVQSAAGLQLVDRTGVRLPIDQVTDAERYLTVTGVHSTPQGPAGTGWGDVRVEAAAALADVLATKRQRLGIIAIDASRYRGVKPPTGPLYLLTESGTRVTWGRPPHIDYPGEVSVDTKLARLMAYVDKNGSLDAPAGPYDIDVTHWGEPTRRRRGMATP
jgi:hypothetical protein